MASYFVQRLAGTIPVLLLISLLVFSLIHAAPGDPTLLLLGEETNAADVAQAKARWGLDQPLHVQYWRFLESAAVGDFGKSFKYSEPVIRVIKNRLPATIELAIFAILIASLLAIPLGVWAGSRPNSWIDNLGTTIGLFGISMPSFWLAIMLILLLAGALNLLPTSGRSTYGIAGPEQTGFYILDSLVQQNWRAVGDALTHVFMPALALGVNMLGILMRVTRSSILEVMNEDFVRTARAKGLRDYKVIWRHVSSNALIPVITVVGLELGTLLSGSIIVETVFTWPGSGSLLITALNARDYPLVTGLVMTYTVAFVAINLIIDGLYAIVDPRIRY
ncbi:MAG: peptide/nickel transport system permease protein [Candidatus Binatota bacterium]|jgi:ABC-type dipeptide/oligopeptide/nickel transport system permease component|nr:peptide/nickel transport system permease protein [Candidatus Binatota bacterium]